MNPGIYKKLTEDQYDIIPGLRSTVLRAMIGGTPKRAHHAETFGSSDTAAKELGQLTHCAILEPDRFARDMVVAPDFGDCRLKANKAARDAWRCANVGREAISQRDLDEVKALRDAFYDHPVAKQMLIAPGENELTVVWDDPTGVRCKARIDRYCFWDRWNTIVDVKTARDASPWAYSAEMHKRGYHQQLAFYRRGLEMIEGEQHRPCFMIVLEKAPVPDCVIYELGKEELAMGARDVEAALQTYAECRKQGRWPGYDTAIQPLKLPAYAYKRDTMTAAAEEFAGGL
jgi:hypothetical protein